MMVYMLALIYKAANSLGISDLLTVGRVVNVLALFSTELLFYFGIKKLTGKRTTAVKYLVISIIYPTMMFMASWVYTATFSMPLIGGLVYLSACILKTESKVKIGIYSSICGVIIAVGYFLRPIVVIIGIAYFICLFIWTIRDKKRFIKSTLTTGFALIFFVSGFVVCKSIDKHYYTGSDRNFPLTHWIAMGLVGNGKYNQRLVNEAQGSNTTEEANERAIRDIQKTLDSYTFGDLMYHQYIKHGTIWGDGTQLFDQRIPGPTIANDIDNFTWGYKNAYLNAYCQMFWLAVQLMIFVYAVSFIITKKNRRTLGLALSILGAYGFYSIWEVKPAYATPFIPLFITLAVLGGESLQNKIKIKKTSSRIIVRAICTALIGIKIIAFIVGGVYSTQVNLDCSTPVLCMTSTHNEYLDNIAETRSEVVQYFSLNKPFNRFKIRVTPTRHDITICEYSVTLTNSKGEILAQSNVEDVQDIGITSHKQYTTLLLDNVYKPKGTEIFKITINGIGDSDILGFGMSKGDNIDTLPGDLIINGQKAKGDLWIKVELAKDKPFVTLPTYIILCTFIILLDLVICTFTFFFIRKPKKDKSKK